MAEETNAPAGQSETGTTPAGGQGENPQGTTPAVDTSTSEQQSTEEIRDPGAYWQAQAEKYQRLLDKATTQAQQAEERLQAVGKQTDEQTRAEYEALKAEVEKERQEAQTARLEALRARAVADAGLPAKAAKFITGDDVESIKAQIDEMKALIPQSGVSGAASAGNPDSGGSTLTKDVMDKMTPQEYIKRRDEVLKFLGSQKK